MQELYIFSVGKPDFGAGSVERIHRLGFKAGLLLDTAINNPATDGYDMVVPIDFSQLDQELESLEHLRHNVAGLLCTYENYIISKAKLGEYFHVPALTVRSAHLATDKALMRRAFEAYDPSITPAYELIESEDYAVEFAERTGFPVIIKPTNLVKSLLVIRSDTVQELRRNVRYAQAEIGKLYEKYHIYDREPQLIIEQFIVGPMYSIAAFVDAAGHPHFAPGIVSLVSAQAHGRDDNYLYSRMLPAEVEEPFKKELYRVARAGIAALAFTSSPAHIELIQGPGGVKLVEIGARTGGYRPRMYRTSYGIDLEQTEIDVALARPVDLAKPSRAYTAVYELFPLTEGRFESVAGQSVELIDKAAYYALKVKVGQEVGPAKNGFKASLIIIISSADQVEFDRLCGMVDTVSIEVSQ